MGREPLPAGLPIALMTELAAGSGFYITMTKGVKGSLAGLAALEMRAVA